MMHFPILHVNTSLIWWIIYKIVKLNIYIYISMYIQQISTLNIELIGKVHILENDFQNILIIQHFDSFPYFVYKHHLL